MSALTDEMCSSSLLTTESGTTGERQRDREGERERVYAIDYVIVLLNVFAQLITVVIHVHALYTLSIIMTSTK